jgi:murein DD-endopeptidase MepM/ murein hydrolase activator NlpD
VVKRADSVLRGYGRLVIIDHGKGVETRYAHCSAFALSVGDTVRAGQIIAYVGNSGNSTANHLHFEVLINGLAYNPMRFLDDYQSIFTTKLTKKH